MENSETKTTKELLEEIETLREQLVHRYKGQFIYNTYKQIAGNPDWDEFDDCPKEEIKFWCDVARTMK
jgi:hypothetical protein